MFESDLVDYFSRTHPLFPAIYIPASVGLSVVSLREGVSWQGTLGLFAGGFIFWTLTEYWLHRLFFHWVPVRRWGARMHFLVHGVHHDWPRDKYRLVMPPAVSISLFFLFLGFFFVVLGPRWVWGVHAGFVLGYLHYDLTHYYVHHFTPTTRYGRLLRRNHMLHHFKEPDRRFGVSFTVWDHVFGTVGEAARSRGGAA